MKGKTKIFLAVLLVTSSIGSHADIIKLDALPTAVQKAVQLQAGDGKISSVEKIYEEGEVIYDVEMMKDGKTRDFSLGENGELLAAEVFLPEVPAAIQKAIQAQVVNGKVGDIYKADDDGEISYDVEMTRDGKTRSFTVSEKGEIVEEQVFIDELPKVLRKAIHQKSAGAKLGDITKSTDEGEVVYDVEMAKGGTNLTATFNADGLLLSEEEPANLADVPDAARKKIKSLAGDGKITGITKVTEDGDVSYDVDVLRGTAHKTLSVSSDGELLDDEK